VQLLCLGLLGEYVGRIYAAVQHRPAFFIGHDSATDPESDVLVPVEHEEASRAGVAR
jgi:dolichol-phosphate mannosyltransferase